jgi:hypothetical protein
MLFGLKTTKIEIDRGNRKQQILQMIAKVTRPPLKFFVPLFSGLGENRDKMYVMQRRLSFASYHKPHS